MHTCIGYGWLNFQGAIKCWERSLFYNAGKIVYGFFETHLDLFEETTTATTKWTCLQTIQYKTINSIWGLGLYLKGKITLSDNVGERVGHRQAVLNGMLNSLGFIFNIIGVS